MASIFTRRGARLAAVTGGVSNTGAINKFSEVPRGVVWAPARKWHNVSTAKWRRWGGALCWVDVRLCVVDSPPACALCQSKGHGRRAAPVEPTVSLVLEQTKPANTHWCRCAYK